MIHRYIAALENNDLSEINNLLTKRYSAELNSNSEQSSFHSSLQIALFDYFEINRDREYQITPKRENLWFPLVGSDTLNFDFKISQAKDDKIISKIVGNKKAKNLNDFFILARENNGWKIDNIDTTNKPIASRIHYVVEQNLALNEISILSSDDITVNGGSSTLELTAMQKNIVIRKIQTAIQKIQSINQVAI